MKRILFSVLFAASLSAEAQTQTFETAFARPLNEVLTDIQNRFGIRLKYDIDTSVKCCLMRIFVSVLIQWKNR